MASTILEVEGVSHAYDEVKVVDACSFSIDEGSISAVIGPNGAGKSTMVSVIAGALRLQHGHIRFAGQEIGGWSSHRIARLGLIRTFQISREFGSMTVLENMVVPPPNQHGENLWNALFRPWIGREEDRRLATRALEVLDAFDLYELRDEYARNLSGGQKRLLELARALMAEPRLLVLDEPFAGVNPSLIDRLAEHVTDLRSRGITFLLVEHNLEVVERLCDRVVVMAFGQALATGRMSELRENPEVVRAYLGGAIA